MFDILVSTYIIRFVDNNATIIVLMSSFEIMLTSTVVLGLVSLVEKASHDDKGDSCSADLQFLSLQITHETTRKKDFKY